MRALLELRLHIFCDSQTDEAIGVVFRVPQIIDDILESFLGSCSMLVPSSRQCARCLIWYIVHCGQVDTAFNILGYSWLHPRDEPKILRKLHDIEQQACDF